jgi:hypothetical protein
MDEKGEWICGECQAEDLNKMFLRTLGANHQKCQAFIKAEDRNVRKYNDGARSLNENIGFFNQIVFIKIPGCLVINHLLFICYLKPDFILSCVSFHFSIVYDRCKMNKAFVYGGKTKGI